jgi:hypothetical protein
MHRYTFFAIYKLRLFYHNLIGRPTTILYLLNKRVLKKKEEEVTNEKLNTKNRPQNYAKKIISSQVYK